MHQPEPAEILEKPLTEKPKRKRDERVDPPVTNTRHHPRHNAKARRVIVRYVLDRALWNDDPITYQEAIREKFVAECQAQRLELNEATIAIVRERKTPPKSKPIAADEIAVHVKAWAKPLPGS